MSGQELRTLATAAGIKPEVVCAEADISMGSLWRVYSDAGVKPTTRIKVEQAIKRLVAKAQAVAV